MADIDNKTLLGIVGLIVGSIVGVYGWLIKHITGHVSKNIGEKVVYEDTCEARRDCIEQAINDLKEYDKERFDRLERLIEGRPK